MAKPKVGSRRGKLGVYWKDALGKRHFVVAEDEEARAKLLAGLESSGMLAAGTSTVGGYADAWLQRVRVRSARATYIGYAQAVRLHIKPARIGSRKLIDLSRQECKAWVVAQLEAGAAPKTVSLRVGVLRGMLEEAREDQLITVNPASALMRALRLRVRKESTVSVEPETIARILERAESSAQRPALTLLAHTGLRISEACGLQWGDIDFDGREARIERQLQWWGSLEPLKTARSRRTLQLSQWLVDEMRGWRRRQQEGALARGRTPTEYVLGIEPADARNGRERIRRALFHACDLAKAPRLTMHQLRHAFASIHLSRGRELKWVQEQLGHSQITTTADLYGGHLRQKNADAADDLANLLRGGQMGLFAKK